MIGFSFQDLHIPLPSSPGVGIDVAWVRLADSTVIVDCRLCVVLLTAAICPGYCWRDRSIVSLLSYERWNPLADSFHQHLFFFPTLDHHSGISEKYIIHDFS